MEVFCNCTMGSSKSIETPKLKHKKGLWSPDEDQKLKDYIMNFGHSCWSTVPLNAGLQRNGKSCRLRWINYLRPGLKRGLFSMQEEETILALHGMLGNKWSQISQHLPGRTDNEIKNYWHSYLKKKVAEMENLQDKAKIFMDSSPSLKLTTRNTSFNSLHIMEGSSTDANQLIPQYFNLPKLLFADWLGLDQFLGKDFERTSQQLSSTNDFGQSTDFQDTLFHGLLLNETSFEQGLSNGSDEIMYSSELKFEDQIYDFSCEDNLSNLNIDDVMNM